MTARSECGAIPSAASGSFATNPRLDSSNRAKDGSAYWVDTTIVPFLDDRGKPWQYMAIRYDITERKLHETKLREQAALTSLGEMAAVVAHEVRNPLAGLRSGMQLLATLFPEAGEGRELLGDMITRVDSLNVEDGETYEIAFVADNPGIWMDHCHNLRHAHEGLVAHLAYLGVTTPFLIGGERPNTPE